MKTLDELIKDNDNISGITAVKLYFIEKHGIDENDPVASFNKRRNAIKEHHDIAIANYNKDIEKLKTNIRCLQNVSALEYKKYLVNKEQKYLEMWQKEDTYDIERKKRLKISDEIKKLPILSNEQKTKIAGHIMWKHSWDPQNSVKKVNETISKYENYTIRDFQNLKDNDIREKQNSLNNIVNHRIPYEETQLKNGLKYIDDLEKTYNDIIEYEHNSKS